MCLCVPVHALFQRAFRLDTDDDSEDPLVSFLLQVTGPAHIPWSDPVWQELLHGYNVWVHVQHDESSGSAGGGGVLNRACALQIQYAPRTSNLAALVMHVTRLLQELTRTLPNNNNSNYSTTTTTAAPPLTATSASITNGSNDAVPSRIYQHPSDATTTNPHRGNNNYNTQVVDNDDETDAAAAVSAFSNRISLVAKARAVSGALNLARILAHAVLAASSSTKTETDNDSNQRRPRHPNKNTTAAAHPSRRPYAHLSAATAAWNIHNADPLKESFTYHCREDGTRQDVGVELLQSLMQFLSHLPLLEDIPELYDCGTLALQLLLVLLSTQLYQPMQSSFQRQQQIVGPNSNNNNNSVDENDETYSFWTLLFQQAKDNEKDDNNNLSSSSSWSPRLVLRVLMEWQMQRPEVPTRSIQYHGYILAQQVVSAKGEKVAADGMYESHLVVLAQQQPSHIAIDDNSNNGHPSSSTAQKYTNGNKALNQLHHTSIMARSASHPSVLDATRGILELSSKIMLLPFRLMSLALGLWSIHQLQDGSTKYDQAFKQHLRRTGGRKSSRTRDVLWLTMSPIADLATSVLLLLTNNERNGENNPFRIELASLADNRWEDDGNDLPDLPDKMQVDNHIDRDSDVFHNSFVSEEQTSLLLLTPGTSRQKRMISLNNSRPSSLTVNFERLFATFGATAHTEPGALLLYTLLQASPTFASSIAVRSDLDTLVLPLLRTFYFATSLRYHVASQQDYHSRRNGGNEKGQNSSISQAVNDGSPAASRSSLRDCPFRSQSQLYVIIILLLLFSQDPSFGSDAFRRVLVASVPWYKERFLKDISLGSILLLVLLRSLSFNLNRQHDAFLLSNCCAVLMNLSTSVVDLHDYTAMRLVSLTVSTMKRYLILLKDNPNNDDDDLTTPTSMHGEAVRTLLGILQQCLNRKNIHKNLHLVYALVYHQADLTRLISLSGTYWDALDCFVFYIALTSNNNTQAALLKRAKSVAYKM